MKLIAWASSARVSPWEPATADTVDRVIEWHAYKEGKEEEAGGGPRVLM